MILPIDRTLSDCTERINALAELIYKNNKEKGFWDEKRNVSELLMLVVSELGEAVEAHRKNRFAPSSDKTKRSTAGEESFDKTAFEQTVKDTFEDEIADAFIRILDLAHGLHIDLGWHVRHKVTYNTSRERLHGKAY